MQQIAISGSAGIVGTALVKGLDSSKFEIVELDLPNHDILDFQDLLESTKDCYAVVHCAWQAMNWRTDEFSTNDIQMTYNVFRAAKENKLTKVIMASSNHANRYDNRDGSNKLSVDVTPIPDSPYGAAKVFMEALGRYYSKNGLQIVCARIGNLNAEDKPKPLSEENPQRWLSKNDWIGLVTRVLEIKEIPNNFVLLNAVSKSKNNDFDWSNPLGWEPKDNSDEVTK